MPKEGEGCHHDSGEARLEDRLVLIPRIMPHAARVARNPRTEVECGDPPKFRMTRADLRLGSWHVIPKLMARAVAQSAEDFLPKETIEKFPY